MRRSLSGALALGEPDVYVDVTVTCIDCGAHVAVEEPIDDGGCGYDSTDAVS